MNQSEPDSSDSHQIKPWKNRQGELIGAPVFLSADEVRELRENGQLTIIADMVDRVNPGRGQ